mmetsp:Transcript_5399/g.17004  ORF Transcript_5399/g.17004 Transcript_5399/m.17004 type:complete len:230 (+) Transcript_5399:480-1169(+)
MPDDIDVGDVGHRFIALGLVTSHDLVHDVARVGVVGADSDVVDDQRERRRTQRRRTRTDEKTVVRRRLDVAQAAKERHDFFEADAPGVRMAPQVTLDEEDVGRDVVRRSAVESPVQIVRPAMRKTRDVRLLVALQQIEVVNIVLEQDVVVRGRPSHLQCQTFEGRHRRRRTGMVVRRLEGFFAGEVGAVEVDDLTIHVDATLGLAAALADKDGPETVPGGRPAGRRPCG